MSVQSRQECEKILQVLFSPKRKLVLNIGNSKNYKAGPNDEKKYLVIYNDNNYAIVLLFHRQLSDVNSEFASPENLIKQLEK